MDSLRRLIHEVHRRSLWQVLGIYTAASWAVIQVVGFAELWKDADPELQPQVRAALERAQRLAAEPGGTR